MKTIDYPVPVYLFGGEGTGWALDADVETTGKACWPCRNLFGYRPWMRRRSFIPSGSIRFCT